MAGDDRSSDQPEQPTRLPDGAPCASPGAPSPPCRLGDFEILREIGRGGMGTVYEARQISLDRKIALKILPPEASADPERLRRFEREARALAAIEHPNIVTVHSVETSGEIHFITMELVRGEPLSKEIPKDGLPLGKLLELAVQLADALAAAHRHGVVHRDLKPANIVVGESGKVKVLDFGLARLRRPTAEGPEGDTQVPTRSEVATGQQVFGTLPYMSPEQIEGKRIDSRSDVFSLGIVLHEMATGRRPFSGDSSAALASAILRDPPPPLADLRGDLPEEVGRIVRRCLEKEPDRRYQTATDLRNDLEDLRKQVISQEVSRGHARKAGTGAARRRWGWLTAAAVVGVLSVAAIAVYVLTRSPAEPASTRQSIVVLPFENLGTPEDEYFSGGLTEEITSRLAVVSGLRVKSSGTGRQYDRKGKSTRDIGRDLDVAYLLMGTVRWDRAPGGKGRVRITPHLVRVSDDTQIWAESFDKVVRDVFAVQTEIAEAVVETLGVALRGPEREALVLRPTENHEAYLAYLRGRYYEGLPHYSRDTWNHALDSYQRAVDLDPRFALAWARLSMVHSRLYYLREDLSEDRLARARQALERARQLAPNAPDVHLASGFYYFWGNRDPDRALESFAVAARELPDSTEVGAARAELLRMRGRYEEALEGYRNALDLSPRDANLAEEAAITCWFLRRHEEALEYANRAIALAPDEDWTYLAKAFNYWSWKGPVAEAREALTYVKKDHEWWLWAWFWQETSEGRYRDALQRLDAYPRDWVSQKMWAMPKAFLAGFAHQYLNEPGLARAEFERARAMLEASLAKQPDDPRCHSSLGITYAALGLKSEAIREGRRATELLPVGKDAVYGLGHAHDLGVIYTMVGENDAALRQIEHLLSIPGWISPVWLRTNPMWKPLWNDARFKVLVDKRD
jgi:TolB-like protein/Tfp pilus assembly protein PilF